VLAPASRRENRLEHIRRLSIAIKENTAVSIVQTKLRTVYSVSCAGKFNIIRFFSSIASFHSRRFTPIIDLTHYFVPRNKKNLAPTRELISYLQNEENSKMEDGLHVHGIRVKQ
jgi:hypothetical protein